MGSHLNVSCTPKTCFSWFSTVRCANADFLHRLLSAGLTDGGTAGLIWGFLVVVAGVSLVFASLAEMSSMQVNLQSHRKPAI